MRLPLHWYPQVCCQVGNETKTRSSYRCFRRGGRIKTYVWGKHTATKEDDTTRNLNRLIQHVQYTQRWWKADRWSQWTGYCTAPVKYTDNWCKYLRVITKTVVIQCCFFVHTVLNILNKQQKQLQQFGILLTFKLSLFLWSFSGGRAKCKDSINVPKNFPWKVFITLKVLCGTKVDLQVKCD